MNKLFQVLVWEKYQVPKEEKLGDPQIQLDFDTYEEAFDCYLKVKKFLCKIIISPSESNSNVLDEDWNE